METSTTNLDTVLQRLADRAEIIDLEGRKGRYADERRHEQLEDVVTEDVVAYMRNGTVRIDGIAAMKARSPQTFADFSQVQHMITNVLVDLDGDRARVRANVVATHVYANDPSATWVVKGYYTDEATRTPKGWRLSKVQLNRIWELDTGKAPTDGR
jgi:3-phenylpropionate/cinnamic acid dioxygenase small subunit